MKKARFYLVQFLTVLIVFLFYYQFVYKHSETIVKANITNDFKHEMQLNVLLLDNVLSRYTEGAKSVSSRSMIRKKIIEYKQGAMSFTLLQNYTTLKYLDGIKALDNCVYALRMVDGRKLVEYTSDANLAAFFTLPKHLPEELKLDVSITDSIFHVQVISPIRKNNTVYGYDILCSSSARLIKSLGSTNTQLQILQAAELKRDYVQQDSSFLYHKLHSEDSIFYISKSAYYDGYFSFGKATKTIYRKLAVHNKQQQMIMTLLFVAILLILAVFQRKIQLSSLKRSRQLEELVDEKTNFLNEAIEELKTSNQMLHTRETELEGSNRTKDKFFSLIAHDLINPIGSLATLANILYSRFDTFDEKRRKESILLLNEGLQNSYKLLDNLLTWSRFNKGSISFNPSQLQLKGLVEQEILTLQMQAKTKKQQVINSVPDTANVIADKNMLSTLVRNLISNAIKFTRKNGLIELGMSEAFSLNKHSQTFYVKDNGVGMSKDIMEDLFQIDKTRSCKGTAEESGTGLGLVLCKEFIEKNKGKIWVESTPEKGSTFYFSLPVADTL